MSIYTKTGDKGQTMLQDGVLIPKHHPIVQTLAALDELNAHFGTIKSKLPPTESLAEFEQIQKNIMAVMSLLSTASNKKLRKNHDINLDNLFADETKSLEVAIDRLGAMIPPIKAFVAYGTCPLSADYDLARAVARRAETCLSQAADVSDYAAGVFPYINRLSDYLYMKARYADFENTITQAVQEALLGHSPKIKAREPSSLTKTSDPKYDSDINLSQAKALLEKIEGKAKELNLPIVAVCCNAAGNPIALHVMEGALLVSYEAAIAKAYTAAALKMPTAELSKLVQPGQPFYGLSALGGGKILPIGGGVPLFNQAGRVIGAIGVSGGTAQEDHELANFGRSNPSAS